MLLCKHRSKPGETHYTRKELRDKLISLGYHPTTVSSAMKTVVLKQLVIGDRSNNSPYQILTLNK